MDLFCGSLGMKAKKVSALGKCSLKFGVELEMFRMRSSSSAHADRNSLPFSENGLCARTYQNPNIVNLELRGS